MEEGGGGNNSDKHKISNYSARVKPKSSDPTYHLLGAVASRRPLLTTTGIC
jgi:hypothetical protein